MVSAALRCTNSIAVLPTRNSVFWNVLFVTVFRVFVGDRVLCVLVAFALRAVCLFVYLVCLCVTDPRLSVSKRSFCLSLGPRAVSYSRIDS